MTELALRRGARRVAVGCGRSAPAARAVAAFICRWEASAGVVLDVVTWPEEAASWLRQAVRFAAADPDLWVTAGAPRGWDLSDIGPGGRPRRELAPGAVHVPSWLTAGQQRWIAGRFHEWTRGPVPIRAAKVRGHEMSVQTVCLGWHWQPYKYTREATDVNGKRVLPFPGWMVRLGRLALAETAGDPHAADGYTPDAALVNYYDRDARLGMHQDKDEHSPAPVVSLSIGDSCTFRFGNTRDRGQPYEDVLLASGDLFVFGGPSRLVYHGITKVHPGTAPEGCGLREGRINITMRVTGLD